MLSLLISEQTTEDSYTSSLPVATRSVRPERSARSRRPAAGYNRALRLCRWRGYAQSARAVLSHEVWYCTNVVWTDLGGDADKEKV